ncbi:MAG: hypothetical protein KC431_21920 [Myxococcales bacterium]|nr:hypothetical protein [Myxococcales bacterium]
MLGRDGGGAPRSRAFLVEDFVQTLTAQLDRAQDALALKARTGRPLTFALKDLSIDLKVFWDTGRDGSLTLRHAGPNEQGASTVHLSFTTITRSMVEENTYSLAQEEDPRGLDDLGGEGFDDDERRRLEMVGVRTVGQFKRMTHGADPRQMEAFLGIPVNKLQAALERSARPAISGQEVVKGPRGRAMLLIRGANLMKGDAPRVTIQGEPVEVVEAAPNRLLVRPLSHHREGQYEVEVGDERTSGFFELPLARVQIEEDGP